MPHFPLPQAVEVSIDSTTWAALVVVLTAVGLVLTVIAWRRRGPAAGLRAFAWTLLPVAAYLTGTLRMITEIVQSVVSWATRLVFSPTVWAGVAVVGLAVLLFLVSAAMRSRGIGVRRRGVPVTQKVVDQGDSPYPVSERYDTPARTQRPSRSERRAQKQSPQKKGAATGQQDEGMDEIEAILKKHGI
jgi:hypothetical protein